MISKQLKATLVALVAVTSVYARPSDYPSDEQISAVIPSPNQDLGYQPTSETQVSSVLSTSMNSPVPIYVSPYVRSERGVREVQEASVDTSAASPNYSHEDPAPAAPEPQASPAAAAPQPEEDISYEPVKPSGRDLKSAASYGHGHHGHGHSSGGHGWLDMGAWSGPKGSFGWYADYPVGKKHGGHY